MNLKGNTMSVIPSSVTEAQFSKYIEASLSKAKRGCVCRIGLYKVFNYILRAARKVCFNHGLLPNIPENLRNRKKAKPGPKRLFNADIYKHRFVSERSFAWLDKFRHLLIRFDRKDTSFLGAHFIAFAMINLRHKLAT
jgi:transposase